MVIHDQGTLPFPGEEGLAVKAGTETFIGLRRVSGYVLMLSKEESVNLGIGK